MKRMNFLSLIVLSQLTSASFATTVTLFELDPEAWKSAVNHNYTTIDFTGAMNFAPVGSDYADRGVTFSSNAHYWNTDAFPNDLWGMQSQGGAWLTFDTPQHWIAADHPGIISIALYIGDELIYTSPILSAAGGGIGNFSGLISSMPFDKVYLFKPAPITNTIAIDDLHFGTIPAPGALGLLALAGLFGARKRRR